MVRVAPGADLEAIAADLGVSVVRRAGRSGWAAVSGTPDALAALRTDARLDGVAPMGIVAGKSGGSHGGDHDDDDDDHDDDDDDGDVGTSCRAEPLQWHLDAANAPCRSDYDVSEWVVAVVGSGVAYDDGKENGTKFKRAKSLKHVPQVAGWDFVDDDATPFDLNGHGTHVATSILGDKDVEGVAAGATLMPVRVLGANNVGTELDLINGIYWAIDHGADVINLSLAFPDGYLPSPPLRRALFEAWQAEVVVVAAAGNEASDLIAWPAASPFVVAAGASRPMGTALIQAEYSSASYGLDVLSPGGDLTVDDNADLYPDGILAESIDPASPKDRDLWLYAGTSQAAALTSGAVVHMLEAGALPKRVPFRLQAGASPGPAALARSAGGETTDLLDISSATQQILDGATVPAPVGFHVATLAYLQQETDGNVTPKAQVTVLDSTGAPVTSGVTVLGTVQGLTGNARVACTPTGPCGQCTLEGPGVDPMLGGQPRPLAFAFQVEAVATDGLRSRPRGAFFLSDELEGITASLRSNASIEDAVLGFTWDAATDPVLGDLAAGVSVTDAPGAGTTTPLAVVFNAEAVGGMATTQSQVDIPVGGTGIIFVPITEFQGDIIEFDPAGVIAPVLATKIVALNGSGLSNLGFSALDFLAPQGTGATCDATPVLLAENNGLGTWPVGTPVGDLLMDEGWVNPAGYPGAASVAGSVLGAPDAPDATASVVGGQPL